MYEAQESRLKETLIALTSADVLNKIQELVSSKAGGKISICFPKTSSQKNKLHLLLETDKRLSLFDIAELTANIKTILGYDYSDESEEVIVELKKLFDEETLNDKFADVTQLSKENRKNVELFINRYYAVCILLGALVKERALLLSQDRKNTSSTLENVTTEQEKFIQMLCSLDVHSIRKVLASFASSLSSRADLDVKIDVKENRPENSSKPIL